MYDIGRDQKAVKRDSPDCVSPPLGCSEWGNRAAALGPCIQGGPWRDSLRGQTFRDNVRDTNSQIMEPQKILL